MRLTVTADVAGVAPADAARWWSDFEDGRADHRFVPGNRRRILERDGARVEMEEETRLLGLRVFRERTSAWVDERAVRFRGDNNFATFSGAYAFHGAPRGTRIVLDADVVLKPALAWGDRLARPVVAGILRADLAAHVHDMRRDLKAR